MTELCNCAYYVCAGYRVHTVQDDIRCHCIDTHTLFSTISQCIILHQSAHCICTCSQYSYNCNLHKFMPRSLISAEFTLHMHGPVTVSDLAASALCIFIAWRSSRMPWGQYGVHLFQEISTKYYLYSILSFSYLVRVKASKRMTTIGMSPTVWVKRARKRKEQG